MSIEGMTFCNSTIKKNYPGSEVFSAPVKTSVNGQIFAKGVYLYTPMGVLMEDIFLTIENGKITEGYAEKNNGGLQEILNSAVGSRYFGEVAFGTNPGLKRRVLNALLNEKVGGSFHMAIGHCYEYTEIDGKAIHLNNGNTSTFTPIHWDITVSMRGDGAVIVDGETIQKDGIFLDPDLSILNFKE